MSFLDSPEQAAQNFDRLGSLPAATPADFAPGVLEGMPDALAKIPQAIGARGALAITETTAPLLQKAAHDFGGRFAQPVEDYLDRQVAIKRQNALDTLPDPNTTGVAAQVAFGVGVQLPEMVGASVLTGTAMGGAAYEAWVTRAMRKAQLEAQGVDHDTADMLATGEGLVAGGTAFLPGVVGKLPASLGARLPYQMATQAALNVPIGIASRAASAQLLEARGYPEMAAQIHPFAAAEIATDALVAAALGPLGLAFHGGPTADALMRLNRDGHGSFDTAPGVHVNVDGLNAHIDALAKATEDLINGRPVDVSGIPLEGEYLPADGPGGPPAGPRREGATVEGTVERPALPAPTRLLPRPPPVVDGAVEADHAGPVASAGDYEELRDLAHGVRNGDPRAIADAAERMAPLVPQDAVLVPIPGRTGRANQALALAEAIARRTGRPIADVLRGNARDSLYELKKQGGTLSPEALAMGVDGEIPAGRLLLIDNVHDTGATIAAARRVLPNAEALVLAAVNRQRPTLSPVDLVNGELEAYRAELEANRHDDIEAMPITPVEGDVPRETIAPPEIPPLPRRSRDVIEPERDSISTAIAKLGGLDRDEVARIWGEQVSDSRKQLNMIAWANGGPWGREVLRRGGRSIDAMVEALTERGYLTPDEHGKGDVEELNSRLQAEIMGERQLTAQGVEWQAERDALLARADFDETDLAAAGYGDLEPPEQVEFERWAAYADELEAADNEIQRILAPDSGAVPAGNGAPGRGRAEESAGQYQGGQSLQARAAGTDLNAQAREQVEARRVDRYTEDLFGSPLPDRGGGGADAGPAESGDIHAGPAVPEFEPGIFASIVAHVRGGSTRIGVERVGSAADAAHVFAYLRKIPQENVAILTVDSNGRPLELVRHTQGRVASADVDLPALMGTALRDERTAEVWVAHNHPSGSAEFSDADLGLNNNLRAALADSGIKYRGLFAIAGRKFIHVEGRSDLPTFAQSAQDIPVLGVRRFDMPIMDRVYRRAQRLAEPISSQIDALVKVRKITQGKPGIVLADTRLAPVAYLPMSMEQMMRMGRMLGDAGAYAHVFRAIEASNGQNLIAVTSGGVQGPEVRSLIMRLGDIAKRTGVRFIDALDYSTGASPGYNGAPLSQSKYGISAAAAGVMPPPKRGASSGAAEGGDELTPYTNADVLKRERDAIAAAKKTAEALELQKQRAIADAERETFALTGSDRKADQNPGGQGSLLEPHAGYPGTVDDPISIDTALAAADARVADAEANAERGLLAAVDCAKTEGDG